MVGAGELYRCKYTALGIFGYDFGPVFRCGFGRVYKHETVARCAHRCVKIEFAVDDCYGRVGEVLRLFNCHPFSVFAKIAYHHRLTGASADDSHRAAVMSHSCAVEMVRMGVVFKCKYVFALGGADFVIVYLMTGIGVAEFLAGFGGVVSAVVEAVAEPLCVGEFCPYNVVVEELLARGIHHIDFGPVAAGARYGIGCIFAVVALVYACESHGAVVAELVGVKEYLGLAVVAVAAVKHTLVLGAVVGIEIILAIVFFRGQTLSLEAVEHLKAIVDTFSEWYLRQIVFCHLVLGLNPSEGCRRCVILQGTVRVVDRHSERFVSGAVARSGRIFYFCLT